MKNSFKFLGFLLLSVLLSLAACTKKNTDDDPGNPNGGLWDGVPTPTNSSLQATNNCGDGEHKWYTTSESDFYQLMLNMKSGLENDGWNIVDWGGDAVGGNGGGLNATKGGRYLDYNGGGGNINLCVWPSQPPGWYDNTDCC